MPKSSLRAKNKDIHTYIRDAQALLQDAAESTGEKASEARQRASRLLDTAVVTAQEAQACALLAGKEAAASAHHYVEKNPWKTISAAASLGLLLGVILGRK